MTLDAQTLAAVTALVAVVVGPAVSIYVARRQIRASVVSTNRQKWMQNLREQLSETITGLTFLGAHRGTLDLLDEREFVERFQKLVHAAVNVGLLLNPNDPVHTAPGDKIKLGVDSLLSTDRVQIPAKTKEMGDAIFKEAQAILKHEWQRVKRGE